MQAGAITSYIDVAQLTLYAFWIFFAGLILYLRREDKREGYPLISQEPNGGPVQGIPPVPTPKVFLLPDGSSVTVPRNEGPSVLNAQRSAAFAGAPFQPSGDPMLDGMGPGAFALRADVPDMTFEDRLPKIVPMRGNTDFFVAKEDHDPRGMEVFGADRVKSGTVVDLWVDRADIIIRYLEVELEAQLGSRHVLLPMNFADIKGRHRRVIVQALLAADFAAVPALKHPDMVTFLEEDKILAYYGGGLLYASPQRLESIL